MKTVDQLWVVEAHDLGALQVRAVKDALTLNRKRWLVRKTDDRRRTTDDGPDKTEDRTGKADRLLLGVGGTIDEALEVERELKRMRRTDAGYQTPDDGPEAKKEGKDSKDGEDGGQATDNKQEVCHEDHRTDE